jgi:uncharacterized protein (TIGR02217 family)
MRQSSIRYELYCETPRFPPYIGIDSVGGATYKTDVIVPRQRRRSEKCRVGPTARRAQVKMPLIRSQADELNNWFHAMKGRAHSFRVQDWRDYTVDQTTGAGSALRPTPPAWRLSTDQFYTIGTLSTYRRIRKPVSGQVSIYRGGVLQTAGGGAGNYASTPQPTVTFVADLNAERDGGPGRSDHAGHASASTLKRACSAARGCICPASAAPSAPCSTVPAHTVVSVSGLQYTISTSTVDWPIPGRYLAPSTRRRAIRWLRRSVRRAGALQYRSAADGENRPVRLHQWNGLELVEDRNA